MLALHLVGFMLGNGGDNTMGNDNSTKSAGIKDIAKALHVSIGTVDRALHNRPGISEKTKVKVLQAADRLGYRPNIAARTLKLNRSLSIGVVLPKHISYFFDPLRDGIRAAAAAVVGVQLQLEFLEYPRISVGDIEALERAYKRSYDGIIFLPGDIRKFKPLIQKFAHSGSKLISVGTELPASEHVAAVTTDSYVSGAIAAELMSYKLPQSACLAVFTGELKTQDHAEKLRGFTDAIKAYSPNMLLLPPLESHDRPTEAYRQAIALMRGDRRPSGLYLTTANSVPVMNALDKLGLLGKVAVITTDFFQDLVPLIEQGHVLATLHQRPRTQGKLAFETLLNSLLTGNCTSSVARLAPHIILRSNVSLFIDHAAETEINIEADLRHS